MWSYQFLVLNCTTPGPLLLLAAMNAFDGSGDETGEVWNDARLDVTVPEPRRVARRGRDWRRSRGCAPNRRNASTAGERACALSSAGYPRLE